LFHGVRQPGARMTVPDLFEDLDIAV
jgi:hypothetical protein